MENKFSEFSLFVSEYNDKSKYIDMIHYLKFLLFQKNVINDVLNQMLEREGLSGGKDFNVGSKPQTQTSSAGAVQTSGGTQAQYY